MKRYSGNRDPRFVAIHRGGDLDLATHRLLVVWAADCAEHVLPLFTEVHPTDTRPSHAIAIAREWASGNATIEQVLLKGSNLSTRSKDYRNLRRSRDADERIRRRARYSREQAG